MSDQRASRRHSFNERAENYHLARPAYPTRVYELLADVCGLTNGTRVVEIGAGTGLATRELVARGATVVAVEPGAELAAYLDQDAGGALRVEHNDFETADLADGGFDLAVAATSFHWVRPEVALPKLARILRPGGWLAVWWHVFGDPEHVTPFRVALGELYERRLPHEYRAPTSIPETMDIESRTAELTAGGWFEMVRVEHIRWEHRLTSDGARRLFGSFPNINEMPADEREAFLDAISTLVDESGGSVADPYVTAAYLARRSW
jgi:SAM-dependent methyltransferase